jgi:hypothetical protein
MFNICLAAVGTIMTFAVAAWLGDGVEASFLYLLMLASLTLGDILAELRSRR